MTARGSGGNYGTGKQKEARAHEGKRPHKEDLAWTPTVGNQWQRAQTDPYGGVKSAHGPFHREHRFSTAIMVR